MSEQENSMRTLQRANRMDDPNKPSPSSLLEYKSLQNAFQTMKLSKGRPVPKKTRQAYTDALSFYVWFCNSQLDKKVEWNLDLLLEEAKEDVKKAQVRIVDFFSWLQGHDVDGYKPLAKKGVRYQVSHRTAIARAYSGTRGFYTNNEILFPRNFKSPPEKAPESLKADDTVPFFKLDKADGKFVLDRALLKHFLSNMKLRDQAIALSLLSAGGQDSGDLFALNVGWATMQIAAWERREKNGEDVPRRFYWHANRNKTGVEFKVFFSREATEFVTRYLQQERLGAGDDEPLFVTAGYGVNGERGIQQRMQARHTGAIFREIAVKMGIKNGGKYQNPLRAKRLRHVFRTACSHAGLDEGYMHVFMGHKSSISQGYLEKPTQVMEIQYSSVEPMLTVFGVAESENLRKIEHDLIEERARRAEMQDLISDLGAENTTLKDRIEQQEQEMKSRLSRMELEHMELKKKITTEIAELKRLIKND